MDKCWNFGDLVNKTSIISGQVGVMELFMRKMTQDRRTATATVKLTKLGSFVDVVHFVNKFINCVPPFSHIYTEAVCCGLHYQKIL